jgi:hypothetical protein
MIKFLSLKTVLRLAPKTTNPQINSKWGFTALGIMLIILVTELISWKREHPVA